MIEDALLHGITNAIYEEFGDSIAIYTEHVEQGIDEPCFFVFCINESETRQLGARAKRSVYFDITFFAGREQAKLRDCAARLYRLMRCIKLLDGSQVNGFDLHHEVIDEVLHFFVTFKPFVLYPNAGDDVPMQEVLEQDVGVNNEQA